MRFFFIFVSIIFLLFSSYTTFAKNQRTVNTYLWDEKNNNIIAGHISFSDGKIVLVKEGFSEDKRAIYVDALALPSFIDLHNHPRWNLMSPWPLTRKYENRFEWRSELRYVEDNYKKSLAQLKNCDVLLYIKAMAAAGGATVIEGQKATDDLACYRGGPARFLEAELASQSIASATFIYRPEKDYVSKEAFEKGQTELALARKEILNSLAQGRPALVHLAEGQLLNSASINEFKLLMRDGLLQKGLAIVHATAVPENKASLLEKKDVGIVWSPTSNIHLYGETLDANHFIENGVKVGLGADWTATGSKNMIREIAVAYKELIREGVLKDVAARTAITIATKNNAELAHLNNLGEITEGKDASLTFIQIPPNCRDLVCLLENNLAEDDVVLTLLAGEPVYGDLKFLHAWGIRAQPIKPMHCPSSIQKGIVLKDYPRIEKELAKVFPDKPPVIECERDQQ